MTTRLRTTLLTLAAIALPALGQAEIAREGAGSRRDALDKMELTRLRTKWRKEWEEERAAKLLQEEVATMESINAKIDKIRAQE